MLLAFVFYSLSMRVFAQYSKLFDFDPAVSGAYPQYGALISDGTYLYGTTPNGGTGSNGVVFKIKKDGSDFQIVYLFTDTTASVPESSVLLIGEYLYGTTKYGGEYDFGTVYKIKTDGSDFSIIADFDRDIYGSDLMGSLYSDGTYLYGMASIGGVNNGGTIYKLKPDGSEFETIHDFDYADGNGCAPWAHLISDGTYLYGMTTGGGSFNQGVAFKIKPNGNDYQILLEFTDDPTGSWGYGGLTYDGTEYLYAMTNNGGEYNRGTIFKIKTDGTGYEKLLDMNNSDGAQPLGSLILVGTTLYGMTELGCTDGDAKGEMFSIETDGSNYTELIDFDGDNGAWPYGTLLYADGAFFGMTSGGGANSYGTVFRYGDIVESIDEIKIGELDMYPNPAENFITISLPQTSEQLYKVEITNVMGEMLFTKNISAGEHEISVSDFPGGMYVVKARAGENVFMNTVVVQ